jgi:PTS system N-acetylglucosamine-specific IIC component
MEFLFLFEAPLLFIVHALLTGLALALAQIFDIHAGFGFSAGFIDYLINYKLAARPLLILPLGIVFALIYFVASYYVIKYFRVKLFEESAETPKPQTDNDALAFINALGGADNIVHTDACITRLRMRLKQNKGLKEKAFIALGAKGIIRPDDTSIQIVLGTKAQHVAESIKEALKR